MECESIKCCEMNNKIFVCIPLPTSWNAEHDQQTDCVSPSLDGGFDDQYFNILTWWRSNNTVTLLMKVRDFSSCLKKLRDRSILYKYININIRIHLIHTCSVHISIYGYTCVQ